MRVIRHALLLAALLGWAAPAVAGRIAGGNPIDRGGNTSGWCPHTAWVWGVGMETGMPLIEFVADGPTATLIFTAQTHTTNPGLCDRFPEDTTICTTSCFMQDRIDNVMIVEKDLFFANLQTTSTCAHNFEVFQYQLIDPSEFVFRETFDEDVDSGWVLDDDVHFLADFSAPLDPMNPSESSTGGCLEFGREEDPPDCGDLSPEDECVPMATASITVGGLTPGVEYVLVFWWYGGLDLQCCGTDFRCCDMPLGCEAQNGDLIVDVFGHEVVPAADASVSKLKGRF